MASGDTKTEAMLNVLGNGGSGDEFRGCCNTKTQQYILDAIDRINSLDPGGGSDIPITVLTDADANYENPEDPTDKYIAAWLLDSGSYILDPEATVPILFDSRLYQRIYVTTDEQPSLIVSNYGTGVECTLYAAYLTTYYSIDGTTGEISDEHRMNEWFRGTDGSTYAGIAGLVPAPATTDLGKFLSAAGVWANVPDVSAVKTLTTADYNFPANNPMVIAGWLLPVGQYIITPQTNFLPDGNSSTYLSDQEIGVLVLTQTPNNNYATYICSVTDGENLYKTQANGTPAPGYPHAL